MNSTEETTTSPSQPVLKGYWELVNTEEVIPSEYSTGDDKENRKYTFEYSKGSIGCNYTRVAYDGIKKINLTELIDTSGGWSMVIDDDAYGPEEKVKIILTANIDHFQRLTPADSGGGGTFGEGKNQQQKVLFVVVSNQGRVGGVKYTYEYFE